jgi:Raf kinase inhibitor-like YbhB/YbcL family protein
MNRHPKHIATGIVMMAALILLTGKKLMHGYSTLSLTSSSFNDGGEIPRQFTCDGTDTSPALSWTLKSSKPVASYVLIVDDPDAQKVVGKTFVHWVSVLSPQTTKLPEKAAASINAIDPAAAQFLNDGNTSTYKGPCPPPESGEHTYRFTLFATTFPVEDMKKEIKTVVDADAFEKGMKKNIIAWNRITGRYRRAQ